MRAVVDVDRTEEQMGVGGTGRGVVVEGRVKVEEGVVLDEGIGGEGTTGDRG